MLWDNWLGSLLDKSMCTLFCHGIFVFLIFNTLQDIMEFNKHPPIIKQNISLIQQFLDKYNALLVNNPFDDRLLDIQEMLSQALPALEVRSHQQPWVIATKK